MTDLDSPTTVLKKVVNPRMYGKGLHPKPKPKRVLGRVGWGIGNSADLISGGVWRSRRVCFDGAYGLNFYLYSEETDHCHYYHQRLIIRSIIPFIMPVATSGPRTLYDKVFDDHLVYSGEGDTLIYIDRHLVHEVTSPQAFEGL
jgi:hypothetical protein